MDDLDFNKVQEYLPRQRAKDAGTNDKIRRHLQDSMIVHGGFDGDEEAMIGNAITFHERVEVCMYEEKKKANDCSGLIVYAHSIYLISMISLQLIEGFYSNYYYYHYFIPVHLPDYPHRPPRLAH